VVLTALLMSGVSAVRTRQQERTTEDIVLKVQIGINNQVKILNDQARDDRRNRTAVYTALVAYCGADEDRAEALLMYCKLRQAFPQTYSDVLNGFSVGGVSFPRHTAYANLPTGSTSTTPELESAVLLHMALAGMAAAGNQFDLEATNSAQDDLPVGNFTGKVFTDARRNPICFKRFLSSVTQGELNAAPYTNAKPTNIFRDPWDPQGKLSTKTATWDTQRSTAGGAVGALFDNNNKVITAYSFGQDKTSGTADDVYGYRLLKQGNKGAP
jgi:hypothetical protein